MLGSLQSHPYKWPFSNGRRHLTHGDAGLTHVTSGEVPQRATETSCTLETTSCNPRAPRNTSPQWQTNRRSTEQTHIFQKFWTTEVHQRSKMNCYLLYLCLFDRLRCMHILICDSRILHRRVPCTSGSAPYKAWLIPLAVPTFSVHLHGFFELNFFWIFERDAPKLSSVVELQFLDDCLSSLSCFSEP